MNFHTTKSDYERCRENGWGPGTRLVGDEGYGSTVIELRYVSPECIVAKHLSHKGKPDVQRESLWTLRCRDWQEVKE